MSRGPQMMPGNLLHFWFNSPVSKRYYTSDPSSDLAQPSPLPRSADDFLPISPEQPEKPFHRIPTSARVCSHVLKSQMCGLREANPSAWAAGPVPSPQLRESPLKSVPLFCINIFLFLRYDKAWGSGRGPWYLLFPLPGMMFPTRLLLPCLEVHLLSETILTTPFKTETTL